MITKQRKTMKKPPHPLTIEYSRKYKGLKIEKLGDPAMSLVLNGIRKGRSYREIAEMLTESFYSGKKKKVTHKDVAAVMNANAEIMAEYQKVLSNNALNRANMILDESKVLVDDMEKLDKVFRELEERSNRTVSTKDLVEIIKAMTDLSRTRGSMIKNFKKLTGQFKEGPSVLIDQSTKVANITTDSEGSSKLAKELAKAEFKTNVKQVEAPKEVVEAEFELEKDEVVTDSQINTEEKAEGEATKKVEENKEDDTNGNDKG